MKCNVDNVILNLEYRVWNGTQYGPDMAPEMLDDGGNQHDDAGRTIYTREEYENAVEYLMDCARDDNLINGDDLNESVVLYDCL